MALVTVLALLIASTASPARATGGDATLQAQLDALVAKGASGRARGRRRRGRHHPIGERPGRVDPRQRLRPNARFGSVTKTFVATLALQLVGEGKLRLDGFVERWLRAGAERQSDRIAQVAQPHPVAAVPAVIGLVAPRFLTRPDEYAIESDTRSALRAISSSLPWRRLFSLG